jgi:hypothetical protein
MSATDVSICSNALLLLGANPINDLSENLDRARLASNLFPTVRDAIIRSFPWNCCITRVVLSPEVTAPAFDWAFKYTLPSDFVKVMSVGELGYEEEFRIEGRELFTDANPCYLRYVFQNTNVGSFDAGLVRVLTLAMAASMAYGITQSTSLKQDLDQQLQLALRQARAVDGQDDTPETFGDFRLLASRFGATPF